MPAGPPWLVIALGTISLLGVIATAIIGPAVVERVKRGPAPAVPPTPAVVAQNSADAIDLIRDVLSDLQRRVSQLEHLQMTPRRSP